MYDIRPQVSKDIKHSLLSETIACLNLIEIDSIKLTNLVPETKMMLQVGQAYDEILWIYILDVATYKTTSKQIYILLNSLTRPRE